LPATEEAAGSALLQKLPACLIGIEACATTHHWSRELQALGHTVRLMPHQQAEHMTAPTNAAT
jgi:transposase